MVLFAPDGRKEYHSEKRVAAARQRVKGKRCWSATPYERDLKK
jgi:hypothetical protein